MFDLRKSHWRTRISENQIKGVSTICHQKQWVRQQLIHFSCQFKASKIRLNLTEKSPNLSYEIGRDTRRLQFYPKSNYAIQFMAMTRTAYPNFVKAKNSKANYWNTSANRSHGPISFTKCTMCQLHARKSKNSSSHWKSVMIDELLFVYFGKEFAKG